MSDDDISFCMQNIEYQIKGYYQMLQKFFLNSFVGLVLAVILCGYQHTSAEQPRFERLFCWGTPTNEENARKLSEIGVTDILVSNKKQYDLAVKYGMTPYCGVFLPVGPYPQVLTKEENEYSNYMNCKDLDRKKLGHKKFCEILHQRRIEKNYRYGGEPDNGEMSVLCDYTIACFNSDRGYKMSKKKIDSIIDQSISGVKGIYFDYLGYNNHNGCYCKVCQDDYHAYLNAKNLPDTIENKNIFYRDILVKYYNELIDYVKSKRPDFKVMVHIYPYFHPDPLFANRTKSDYCGQTVAWYFSWPLDKVMHYTKVTVDRAKDYYPDAEGIPFVGLNARNDQSLAHKTPERLEKELQTILAAGGRTLQVCNGLHMIKPGYYEVFKKYCTKVPSVKQK